MERSGTPDNGSQGRMENRNLGPFQIINKEYNTEWT
jgi:hypothetical protein